MADLTKKERDEIARRVAEVFASEKAAPAKSMAKLAAGPAAMAASNPRQFFCQNWPLIRTGLDLLRGFVPLPVRPLIGLVIRAGDAASGVICTP